MNINICQVSLNRDIPLIIENFKNFKKFYQKINFLIICPHTQIEEFKQKLNFSEVKIIAEEEILEFKKFEIIYKNLNKGIQYRNNSIKD